MSDVTTLSGFKVHPKAARVMVAIMIVCSFLGYFANENDWSSWFKFVVTFPALFCMSVLAAQDMRIWKKTE